MLALILSSQATCATPDSVPAARAQALCLGTCPWSVSDDDADKVRALPPQSEPRPSPVPEPRAHMRLIARPPPQSCLAAQVIASASDVRVVGAG